MTDNITPVAYEYTSTLFRYGGRHPVVKYSLNLILFFLHMAFIIIFFFSTEHIDYAHNKFEEHILKREKKILERDVIGIIPLL